MAWKIARMIRCSLKNFHIFPKQMFWKAKMCYPMKECRDLIPMFMDKQILFFLCFHIFSSPTSLSIFPSRISPNRTFYLEMAYSSSRERISCYRGYITTVSNPKRQKSYGKTHFPHLSQSYNKKKGFSTFKWNLTQPLELTSVRVPLWIYQQHSQRDLFKLSPSFFRRTYPSPRIRISDRSTTPEQQEHVTIRTC